MRQLLILTATVGVLAAGMALAQTTAATPPGATQTPQTRVQTRRDMMKALNLTAAQKQQAKAIHQATRQNAQPLAQQLRQDRQALATAIQAGDSAKIQQLATEVGNLRGQVLAIRSDGLAKFYALLTPDQKAKAAEFRSQFKQARAKNDGGE
ncbi:MAG TPA: Spy/CpxP family protein refolding chaperone [Bryobacteraceae bacterium]|nr:Spy/CpxP family protein refolding chaperone [Bryobacteraceae bacterium]